jgi:hypothetical protein
MQKRIACCIVLLLVMVPRPGILAQDGSLDSATIQEALELGRRGNPGPYRLHATTGGLGVAGAVYTPFVRIALLSRAAHLRGRRLTAAELPAEMTKPIAYIAVQWYCENGDCSLPAPAVPIGVLLTPHSPCYCAPSVPLPGAVMPLWVTRTFSVFEMFGAETPKLAVAVAAFPMSSIKSGYWVSSCAGTNPTQCDDGRSGPITSNDVATWR